MSQEGGTNRPTLVRPAPEDPDKAPIENVLDVLELGVFGPVSFLTYCSAFFQLHRY